MKYRRSVTIVSPIYNDIHALPDVLPKLLHNLKKTRFNWNINLIDDGSMDGSVAWIKKFSKKYPCIQVDFHSKNIGIALTYRELYAGATGDIIVLFSLDGEWDPADVIRLIESIESTRNDIVIGVRSDKKYTIWRSVVSSVYNWCTRVIFRVDTKDAGSIKAFTKDVLTIPISSYGVFDEAERMIRAVRAGKTISYIPIKHKQMIKIRRGIRIGHVIQAAFDMARVFIELI